MFQKFFSIAHSIHSHYFALALSLATDINKKIFSLRKASRVEDVYKLADILTEKDLDVLEETAKALLEEFSTAELVDEAVKERT